MLERLRRLPLGRTEYPEDMVEPAIFLASDGASYVTVHDDRYRPEWARSGAQGWAT